MKNNNDWQIDGGLVYRLGADGANSDEINVTMSHGTRDADQRFVTAAQILLLIQQERLDQKFLRAQVLEEAAKICDSVSHWNPMTASDCADAIRALKTVGKVMPMFSWIKCSDSLPEQRERSYQVAASCVKKYGDDTNYPGQGVKGVYQDWVIRQWPQNFTHWMPLPILFDSKED